jgi:5-methylcytosine-specific restriction protein A
MKLKSIPPRIKTASTSRLKVLDTKAGSTERIRGHAWMDIRRRILLRDKFACQCCGLVRMDNEIDHTIPLEQGGSNDDDNLQTLCKGCHAAKTASEASTRAGMAP